MIKTILFATLRKLEPQANPVFYEGLRAKQIGAVIAVVLAKKAAKKMRLF